MTDTLRVSDIFARGVAAQWYEGVALVREVTERLTQQPGGYSVPELHQIELQPDGHVDVVGGSGTDEPVRRLGQLLQAVLVNAEPPVQLRLTVSQATAPAPRFTSVADFYEALGYYERPDRAGVLRQLYSRAMVLPLPMRTQPAPTVDTLAPLPVVEQPETPRVAPVKRRRAGALAIAAVVLVACAVGVAMVRYDLRGQQLKTAAVVASDAVGGAVVAGLSTVTERAGLGRLAAQTPTPEVVPATPVSIEAATPSATVGRRPNPIRKPFTPKAFDLNPVPALADGGMTPAMRKLSALLSTMTSSPSGSATPAPAEAVKDDTVYSLSSAGVVPPIGVRPQLPNELPANISKDQLARIELVVLPDGSVGSVKLLGHRNVHDAMFLSAVKAWEFKPALKDGQPVSYRKIVWMAFQ